MALCAASDLYGLCRVLEGFCATWRVGRLRKSAISRVISTPRGILLGVLVHVTLLSNYLVRPPTLQASPHFCLQLQVLPTQSPNEVEVQALRLGAACRAEKGLGPLVEGKPSHVSYL